MPSPKASQRRYVLRDMKEVKAAVSYIQGRWNVGSSIPSGNWRKRRPDEYPEASPIEWRVLIGTLDAMIGRLEKVRREARVYLDQALTEEFERTGKPQNYEV